jgi:SNF2 family DNA or RNA helicase
MQQISCGFAHVEDLRNGYEHLAPKGTVLQLANPRMDALLGLLDQLPDRKVIIWCRFQHDVEAVTERLRKDDHATLMFYGPMSDKDRSYAKDAFVNLPFPHARYLVATPDSAGRGLDGLQKGCSHAIYYSNSFNAIARWQSEDRIHRIGQRETASYFDLIARGSPDRAILRNLRAKKDLSALVLDDLRRIIEGEDQ